MHKQVLRQAKNFTKGYSEIQIKVRDATSNDPNSPPHHLFAIIADATYSQREFLEIFYILDKRLNDHGKNWRHVYKALVLLEFLLTNGSEAVVEYSKENIHVIKTLKEFQYIDEEGRDQGLNVRMKCKDLTSLLADEERLKSERAANRAGDPSGRTFSVGNSRPSGDGYYDEDSEMRKALEESKRTAEEDERRRREAMKHENELQRALSISEQEHREREQQELEKDQIDFFSPVSAPTPTINVVNPYSTGYQAPSFNPYGQAAPFTQDFGFFTNHPQLNSNMFAQQQEQLMQQQLAQQQMQQQMAQQQLLAQQQQQQQLAASFNSANNPFNSSAMSVKHTNLIDEQTLPEFNKTNATIDPFAAVATKRTADTLRGTQSQTINPFGASQQQQQQPSTGGIDVAAGGMNPFGTSSGQYTRSNTTPLPVSMHKTDPFASIAPQFNSPLKASASQNIRNSTPLDDLLSLDPLASSSASVTMQPNRSQTFSNQPLGNQLTGNSVRSTYSNTSMNYSNLGSGGMGYQNIRPSSSATFAGTGFSSAQATGFAPTGSDLNASFSKNPFAAKPPMPTLTEMSNTDVFGRPQQGQQQKPFGGF